MKNFLLLLCVLMGVPVFGQDASGNAGNSNAVSASIAGGDMIQSSVAAYNNKDINAYIACFSPQVEVYNASGVLMYKGKEKLKEQFELFFNQHPGVKRQVIERINAGGKVIEREKLTGMGKNRELSITSVYELENGLIKAFYFVGEF